MSASFGNRHAWEQRLANAVAVFLAGAFALGAISLAMPSSTEARYSSGQAESGGSGWAESLDAASMVSYVAGGRQPQGPADEVPFTFGEELFDGSDALQVAVSQKGSVVGMTMDGSADRALAHYGGLLEGNGWVDVGRSESARTFCKDEGCYRWACLQVTQIGASVCLVAAVA